MKRLYTFPPALSFPEPPVVVSSPGLDGLGLGWAESGLAVAEKARKWFHHPPQYNAALCYARQNGAVATMTAAFSPLLYSSPDHIHVPLRLGGLDNRQL